MAQIRWSKQASTDFFEICEYIGKDSFIYAQNYVSKILTLIENLKIFPLIGREISERNDPKIRELIFQSN